MKKDNKINRRKFIEKVGTAAAVTLVWPYLSSCESNSSTSKTLSQNTNSKVSNVPNDSFKADLDIKLSATEKNISILSGKKTRAWVYKAEILEGSENAIQTLKESYLGPIIKLEKGQKVRIRFQNNLPEVSIVHWHGMHVPEEYDGHPKDVIDNGETYIYEFEVMNRAGTYWFHPHPHGRTGPQVYNGLAGLFIVTDKEEEQLNLPTGEFDLPVVIQDRSFDGNNQLVYLDDGPSDRMAGFLGDQILINGKADQTLKLKAGCVYRLRLLNGSNSRIYKLAWDDGSPITVFGTDGGLLEAPKTLPYLMLGPAKRADVWLDLSNKKKGDELIMKNASFPLESMHRGMMHGSESALPQGSEYPVLKVYVNGKGKNSQTLPRKLRKPDPLDPRSANNLGNPRQFIFAMGHMKWTINGRTWETTGVSEEETVQLGSTEVWELINGGVSANEDDPGHGMMGNGGMMGGQGMMGNMMQMPHPVHIHQVQFNILERNVDSMSPELWDSVKEGFINEGWHDTVLLMPGMKAKVVMQFNDFKGLFVYHCHNLEHEDMGMMRNFRII